MLSMALPNRPWASSPFPGPSTPPWPSPSYPSPPHSSLALTTPPWSPQLLHGPHYPIPALSTPHLVLTSFPWSSPNFSAPLQPCLVLSKPPWRCRVSQHQNTPFTTPQEGGGVALQYNTPIYCSYKLINTNIPVNYICIYAIKQLSSTFISIFRR